MPPTTKVQTFIDALRTKQTKITLALDALMRGKARALTDDEFRQLEVSGAFDGPYAGMWPLSLYITQMMMPAEVAHLESWPAAERELVRAACVEAIKSHQTVRFFWDLGDNTAPQTVVQYLGDVGYVVTFCSPRANVRGPDSAGEIVVES